jgi:hypothetical protein
MFWLLKTIKDLDKRASAPPCFASVPFRYFPLWSVMAVVFLMASGVSAFAQNDLPSTPQQIPYEASSVAKETPALLQDQELFATISQTVLSSSLVGIGRNFQSSQYNTTVVFFRQIPWER